MKLALSEMLKLKKKLFRSYQSCDCLINSPKDLLFLRKLFLNCAAVNLLISKRTDWDGSTATALVARHVWDVTILAIRQTFSCDFRLDWVITTCDFCFGYVHMPHSTECPLFTWPQERIAINRMKCEYIVACIHFARSMITQRDDSPRRQWRLTIRCWPPWLQSSYRFSSNP